MATAAIINEYFQNIVFQKVEHKENFIIYAANVRSSYGSADKTFALAFVPTHLAIMDRATLHDLNWSNLQTRLLPNGYPLQPQRWDIPPKSPAVMFKIVDRNAQRSKYVVDGPHGDVEMVLIHDPKKNTMYQYHNTMNIIAALMSFRCVISSTAPLPVAAPRAFGGGSPYQLPMPPAVPNGRFTGDDQYVAPTPTPARLERRYQNIEGDVLPPSGGYISMHGVDYSSSIPTPPPPSRVTPRVTKIAAPATQDHYQSSQHPLLAQRGHPSVVEGHGPQDRGFGTPPMPDVSSSLPQGHYHPQGHGAFELIPPPN